MTEAQIRTAQVGDFITFSATTREGRNRVTRKITAIRSDDGAIGVKFHGWDPFWIAVVGNNDEIHAITTRS